MDSSFMEDRQLMRTQLNLLLPTTRLWDSQDYVQHGDTSCYLHSIAVAWYSLRLARRLQIPVHAEELVRGALLHDYFLYDWHRKDSPRLHGLRHPFIALKNASRCCQLTWRERQIIQRHMFPLVPLPPLCREAVLVCLVDKGCAVFETLQGRYRRLLWAQRMARLACLSPSVA